VAGAFHGSRVDKLQELCGVSGVSDVEYLMAAKRIRWAASVYGRHFPELAEVAEPILLVKSH